MKTFNKPLISFAFLLLLAVAPFIGKASQIIEDNEAYATIQQHMENFKNGVFVVGTTTPEGIKSIVGPYVTEEGSYMSLKKSYSGYSLTAQWTFTSGTLMYYSLDTYYDADQYDKVPNEAEEVKQLMISIFGEPYSTGDTYAEWEFGEMYITFDFFEDGYSILIDPLYNDYGDYEGLEGFDDLLCVGDMYTLKLDLKELFLTNINNGSIKIGSTTKAEMLTLTGNETNYAKDYAGLRVSGYYSFNENGTLSAIDLDYFYECEGALSLMEMDIEDIMNLINEAFGSTGVKDSDTVESTIHWTIDGQSVSQMNFSDGYSISLSR